MRKFFAFVFAFLFFILLPAWLVLYNVSFNLLDADFYKNALNKANFYEEIVDVAIDGFTDYMGEMQAEQGIEIAFISQDAIKDEIKDIAHQLISEEFLQKNIENFVDGTTSWLKSDQDITELKVTLDIEDIKTKAPAILGDKFQNMIMQIPDCTSDQVMALEEKAMAGEELSEDLFTELNCLPAESKEIVGQMMGSDSDFETYLSDAMVNVPDQIELGDLFLGNEAGREQIQQVEEGINTFRNVYHWLVISFWILSGVLFLFLVFIALLTMKSVRSMFKWLGLTIFIPSLIMTVLVLTSRLIASLFLKNVANFLPTSGDIVMPTGLLNSVNDLVLSLVAGFANKIMLPVFILCGIGFVLFIVAFFFKKKPKQPKAAAVLQAPVAAPPPSSPAEPKPKSKSKK